MAQNGRYDSVCAAQNVTTLLARPRMLRQYLHSPEWYDTIIGRYRIDMEVKYEKKET